MARMARISATSLGCVGLLGDGLAVKAWYAEIETPAARQAAATGKLAAFWASTQR
jgi:hypothetical protein